jgi:hypothetical protein
MREAAPELEPRLQDDDEEPDQVVNATSPLPTVPPPARTWEYRVEAIAVSELTDVSGFAAKLNEVADEGWDLFDITDAGDRRLLVLRRPKQPSREQRRVGFLPHPAS